MGSLVRIENLCFRYFRSERWALYNVNLLVEDNEFILVTGPSGCGKTTLCRCINGLIPHFYEGEYKGDVYILDRIRVKDHEPYELAEYVGMVFQDPESQLITSSVEREIAFGLENLGIPREEIIERIEWVLDLLNIRHLRKRAPYELSGGEQQKVAIASVLALKPKVLVLDEPTANLDPASSAEILQLLQELRAKMQINIILVEHRLSLIADKVDRIVLMDQGKIIAEGNPRVILGSKKAEVIGIEIPKVIKAYRELFGEEDWVPLNSREFAEVVMYALESHRS